MRESDEPIGRSAAFEQGRTDTEQLRAVVDESIAVAVERQERFVAARTHPLHVVTKAVGVDVKRHTPAGGAELDAVPASVDDDRAALSPDVARDQTQKQADERFHWSPFLFVAIHFH
ncbi:MAG: hypothetical protein ACREXP_05835 [Steroidobacteraceae bacterium]